MFYIYIYCWQCSCGKRKKKDGDLTLHAFTHFTEMSEGLLRKLITGRLRDDIQLVESANAKEFLGKYPKKNYRQYYEVLDIIDFVLFCCDLCKLDKVNNRLKTDYL